MKTKDRAAILARLPLDRRDGPLVVDANNCPLKAGVPVVDAGYSGEVLSVEEDEGRVIVDVTWRELANGAPGGLERYVADPHDPHAEYPDISTWRVDDFTVEVEA